MKYTEQLEFFGIKLGLQQITTLLDLLDNPQKRLKFVHVAGTNGKGSVCAMVESGLRAVGFKTGFYSSPHLVSINERFRINGIPIDENRWNDICETVRIAADKMKNPPSFFEFTTAAAALLFHDEKCEICIWETGMGGRLDATNVVMPILTVITRIGMDHTAYLGETLSQIALEKAGIIKSDIPLIIGTQSPGIGELLEKEAAFHGSAFHHVQTIQACESQHKNQFKIQKFSIDGHEIALSLQGKWQQENAATAYTALQKLSDNLKFNLDIALKGWENVVWPARFQISEDGKTIIDGAHNPDGASVLTDSWGAYFPGQKATILFANFSDKETEKVLTHLLPIAKKFIFTPVTGAKGRPSADPAQLKIFLNQIAPDIPCECVENIHRGIYKLHQENNLKLITGSLYLAGAYLAETQ